MGGVESMGLSPVMPGKSFGSLLLISGRRIFPSGDKKFIKRTSGATRVPDACCFGERLRVSPLHPCFILAAS
jgi:hypothetical protein